MSLLPLGVSEDQGKRWHLKRCHSYRWTIMRRLPPV
jgi:hypothetical protein